MRSGCSLAARNWRRQSGQAAPGSPPGARKSKSPPCRTKRDKSGATAKFINQRKAGPAPFSQEFRLGHHASKHRRTAWADQTDSAQRIGSTGRVLQCRSRLIDAGGFQRGFSSLTLEESTGQIVSNTSKSLSGASRLIALGRQQS